MLKKQVFWLILLCLVSIFTFVIAETSVRIYLNFSPLDEKYQDFFEINYKIEKLSKFFSDTLDPNSPLYYTFEGIKTDGKTFIQVYYPDDKPKEFTFVKPKNTTRIVIVGDSLTELWQIPGYQNYTDFLKNTFSKHMPNVDVEIIPIGVGGYNTWQEMHFYKANFQALEKDVLILQLCPNDIDVMEIKPKDNLEEPNNWPDYDIIGRRFFAPDYSKFRINFVESRLLWWLNRLTLPRHLDLYLHSSKVKSINSQQRDALTWFNTTKKAEIKFFTVLFPVFHNSHSQPELEYLRSLLANLKIEYLDLLPHLQQYGLENLRVPYDYIHPNKEGHTRAAEAIFNFMVNQHFLSIPNSDFKATNQGIK
jgi:lysophospholipase L1-like esterase